MNTLELEVLEQRVEGVALEAQKVAHNYGDVYMVVDYEGPIFQIGFGGEALKAGQMGEGDITAYEDAVDGLKPNHAVIKTLEAVVRQVDNAHVMQGSGVNLIPADKLTYRTYPLLKFASMRCEEVLDRVAMKSRKHREVLPVRTTIPQNSLLVIVNDAVPGSSSHNAILREIKSANPVSFETCDIANVIVPEYKRETGAANEQYRRAAVAAFETGFASLVKARDLKVDVGNTRSFSPADFYKLSPRIGNVRGE
jgi:hypothetical protein